MTETQTWYSTWFDSPYYHLLYEHRNEGEAEFFLKNLIEKLHWPPSYKILDAGCGKGRHARFLYTQGFDVTGIDLSAQSIHYNKQFENERLHFYQWDMRQPFAEHRFDVVLNLFTSFGYFETDQEHIQTLHAFREALQPHGTIVIDFMNVQKAISQLIPKEHLIRQHVQFDIQRYFHNGLIIKEITVKDNEKTLHFYEKVRAYSLKDFQELFAQACLRLWKTFGNYRLEPYQQNCSERLILVAKVAS